MPGASRFRHDSSDSHRKSSLARVPGAQEDAHDHIKDSRA